MSKFQRENRYLVVKLSDLSAADVAELVEWADTSGIPERECVVVESDWPIYDETWENVQRLAEGRPSIQDELGTKVFEQHKAKVRAERERDALASHVERGKSIMASLCEKDFTNRSADQKLFAWYMDCPKTSLAKLKAQWQAEALDKAAEFADRVDGGPSQAGREIAAEAERLRRQAGGDA